MIRFEVAGVGVRKGVEVGDEEALESSLLDTSLEWVDNEVIGNNFSYEL